MDERIGKIAEKIEIAGGRMFLVGGAVRDSLRGVKPKDFDFCIVGITEHQAKTIISIIMDEDCVDVISNAPVFNCCGFEFAMARIESQVGRGKGGFTFESSPRVTIKEDLKRRDFTAGAIAKDVLSGGIVDPFNGCSDIRHKVLRHVDDETFVQSPERVFRGISQAARFGWTIDHTTIELMTKMQKDFDTVPVEQIWLHFEKAGSQLNGHSWRFVWFLFATGWNKFFPEIKLYLAEDALKENAEKEEHKVEWFIASLMAGMSISEQESFLARINAPKAVGRVAKEFDAFGDFKPQRWVEGRDIAHVVPAGKEMGKFVNWCFISQINGITKSKQETVEWVEKTIKG